MFFPFLRMSVLAAVALIGVLFPSWGAAFAADTSANLVVAQVFAQKGNVGPDGKKNRPGKANKKKKKGQAGNAKRRKTGAGNRRKAGQKPNAKRRRAKGRSGTPGRSAPQQKGVVRRQGVTPKGVQRKIQIPKAAKKRKPGGAAQPNRNLNQIRRARTRLRNKAGQRQVIRKRGNRRIVRQGGRTFIRKLDNNRLGRRARTVRRERRNGRDFTRVIRRNGSQIVTVRDRRGRIIRRVRIGRNGRRTVLFTNNYRGRRRNRGGLSSFWLGLALPLIAIPTYRYIVDSRRASYDDMYDALSAPPIESLDDQYTLDEVRYNYPLRARMRSVDVNTIEFASGSWLVDRSEYGRLKNLANAMRRVIRRNEDEMFLIEGHTDAVGDDDDNLALSDRRAESVAVILSEEFGVPPENMVTQGYGEQFLREQTNYASQINRRVTVRRITPLLARSEETGDDEYFDDDDSYVDRN